MKQIFEYTNVSWNQGLDIGFIREIKNSQTLMLLSKNYELSGPFYFLWLFTFYYIPYTIAQIQKFCKRIGNIFK